MENSKANAGRLAIIGMSFRFPGGASTAAAYWAFLNSGRSAICETPRERFDIDAYYSPDPDAPGTTYSRVAGYVDDPFRFDRKFFRTSAAEALETDPQQRWMLELTWAALENAGLVPSELRGKRVGLFMTTGEADYGRRTIWSGDPAGITTYSKLGNLRAMAPGRVAHLFGFSGPALFVDTTCSSSLVAIHLAAQSLRTGDCDIAIAGGINLILGPEETIGVARLQAMSASGHCRPFDADADGYIRGEGGGVVVMKRFEDAHAHGDRIDAVLAGSAINSDGASNGLTAPNGAAQEAVIRHALARAGARPEEVAYVEAHGTGTSLGDPIELSALRNVYTQSVARQNAILVGSVKAQVGHLEGAAGMAAIIKAILILRNRYVPAQVNFSTPNPRFRWEGAQLEIPQHGRPLDGGKPMVGVSGFGITGTNVHLILAAHESDADATAANVERERVLTLSGRSPQARERLVSAYRECLLDTAMPLRDICHTASVRRDHFTHRVALVGTTRQDFIDAMDDFLNTSPSGKWHAGDAPKKQRLAFLFPGQGAWQPGVGAELYNGNWIFRQFADTCFSELEVQTARDVLDAILGRDPAAVRHHPGQLAHFVVCYSLARTWMELGQRPDLLIGHSLGEHVAAVIGGVMTLADGLKAVEARGRLFDTQTPRGAMLAVAAGVEELSRQFEFGTNLFVAGVNGPEQTVVSGTQEAVAQVQDAMTAAGKRVSLLKTYDTPGHSPMLRSMRDAFRRALEPLTLAPARIPIVSTLTGQPATAQVANVEHWLDLVEQPVRFAEALHLASDGKTTFIEVGPGAALSKLARAKASGDWQCAISSLADGPDGDEESEMTGFAHACAHLYSAGHAVAWSKMYGNAPSPAELPTYRFDEERFELPFPQRKQAAPAHNVEQLQREIAEIGAAVGSASASADAAGQGTNSEQLLATIRTIAASVASDTVSLMDDVPLVQLGMDSLALTELRVRLHQAFGKMPPMSMLARGASLITLAGFFASSRSRCATEANETAKTETRPVEIDERTLTVSLREGSGPVIALVHPIGGDVLSYQDLASVWPGDPSIVAVRHPYADHDREVGYLTIEQLASLYRSAFVKAVGRMPDLIGGWSFGGLVAHEMAAQWEAEGSNAPPLLIVDSPLYNGAFATRLTNIIKGVARDDEASYPVDRLLADPRFDSMLDSDFSLSDVRRRAHPDVFAHLARLHASSAAAVALHRPRQTRTRISYALATRGKGGTSGEQVAAQLRLLTNGDIAVKVFDDDHDSIVRAPSAEGLANFLDGTAAGEEQLSRVTQA
ncbi:beta-ketoacyl synthase N-terminal-like domain-containing protein [Paraburkholderia sp. SARCC-3016]|uniref:type I polyketide synthase n=1 Tax=Paraburkholderia sp. SARCC-3016 TaxID=3058611 RepID=UPI00280A2FF6|nr:beta-ketoacyl synthase N-terminal-like domain-containing protein [Paraburkholderia sp. SARCC-3016]MDQ7978132.1 beta-ketoacyl synthase N-terminal-like domain-containing protein [Paraburkholderia sp. SARCC-3016]